ncbi:Serglycin [Varanus komodoensis]|nr:Serglycin [Varanus komodoensis]
MWVKCRPDARSANCIEGKGPLFAIPDGKANMILPPKADPMLMKTFQQHPGLPYNGDEYGSGNYMELESGSGLEYDLDDLSTSNPIISLPDEKLKLKLTKENLFFQGNSL